MKKIDIISILLLVFITVVFIFQFKYERTCSRAETEYNVLMEAMNETLKEEQIISELYLKDSQVQYDQYLKEYREDYQEYLNESKQLYLNIMDRYNKLSIVTCNMHGVNKTEVLAEGLYFYEGFYCVATLDKTPEEIASTKEHEICHNLISIDKDKHFCKG